MDAIVSVTADWGIGRDGSLLVRNKADMRRFKELTMGGSVIMGRKTFESLPGGPLVGRNNIVLTRSRGFAPEGVEVARSIDEARELFNTEGEQALIKKLFSFFYEVIDSGELDTTTTEVTLQVYKNDEGAWEIKTDNDAFYQALYGGANFKI